MDAVQISALASVIFLILGIFIGWSANGKGVTDAVFWLLISYALSAISLVCCVLFLIINYVKN